MPDMNILLPALATLIGAAMLVRSMTGHRAQTSDFRSQRILWGLFTALSAILLLAAFFQD